MITRPDIENREDIETFIRHFYENVLKDETIGLIFTEIVQMDWDHHIPLITDFWETVLLDNPVYKNNAMAVHYDLNKKFSLQQKHFEAWLSLFNRTIDSMYCGTRTELAKKRAKGIADLMLLKMSKPFIQ